MKIILSNLMRKNRRGSALWEYLEKAGVLENGSDDEIKAVKKAYRKQYLLHFKQRQRTKKPEFAINFAKDNGEYEKVQRAALRHKLPVTGFIRASVLAYIDNAYLVPDRGQIARLEQILSIVHEKEKFFWERERKFEQIEKRIEKLETSINEVFRNPPLLTRDDSKNQIT